MNEPDDEVNLPEFFGDVEDEPDIFEEPEEEAEAAADDDDGEEPQASGAPKHVPYKRLQKVIAERNQLRDKMAAEAAELGKLQAKAEQHQEFLSNISDRYGKYDNPVRQLGSDADFMDALEALVSKDPEISALYRKVVAKMGTEPVKPGTTVADVGKGDPRLDQILEREARRTITDTLNPLKLQPKYTRLIEDHILAKAKIGEVDANVVKKLTNEFIKERGFTVDEMRAKVDPAAKKEKPPTGSGRAPATQKAPAKSESKATAANSNLTPREQLAERRMKILDDLIAGVQ